MKKTLLFLFVASFHTFNSVAQPPVAKRILFTGGVLHAGNGQVIQNSVMLVEGERISLTGDASLVRIASDAFDTIIRLEGKHIYPGLIALHTVMGLSEIEAVRATNDFSEVGTLNPSARSLPAYNTDSKIIPTVRSNGVLLVQVVPKGGMLTGQSSVMKLDGWNYEDALYKADDGMHLNWPSMRIYRNGMEDKQREKSEAALFELRKVFEDAQAYASAKANEPRNLHLESMRGLFNGTQKLYVYCNYVKEIIAAVNFCRELKIKMVLVGGNDSWMITSLLKENNIPVVILETHRLPTSEDENIMLPYQLPATLIKAGIKTALTTGGFWQVRNLPFQAGTTVAHGLTKEEALTSITLTPAEILGIDDHTGSLEKNKDATFIISDGDILDMRSSGVGAAYISGKVVNLDNMQKDLYEKYLVKYHH